MIHALYQAYAGTAFSHAVRDSRWLFAVFEMVHLVGLALLGGSVLIAAGTLAGWRIGNGDRAAAWRGLRGVGLAGLAAMIGSGLVLVGVNPLKYYFNPSFNAKLWLLLAAVATAGIIDRLQAQKELRLPAIVWRILAALLALLFLSVALAGRAIGLL